MANSPITPVKVNYNTGDVLTAQNLDDEASAINRLTGFRTQATANSTLTLTVADFAHQEFTGTTAGQIVQMPATSTLGVGMPWVISNKSTQTIAVNSSGGNLIFTVPAATDWMFTCNATSGTTATSWSNSYVGASAAPGAPSFNVGYAYTSSTENTSSTTYTGLTTATAVTVTTGTKALVSIKSAMGGEAVANVWAHVSFAISGATTLAASDERSIAGYNAVTSQWIAEAGATFVVTGLTAGSNTFTLKFNCNGGAGTPATFYRRSISVVDLGS